MQKFRLRISRARVYQEHRVPRDYPTAIKNRFASSSDYSRFPEDGIVALVQRGHGHPSIIDTSRGVIMIPRGYRVGFLSSRIVSTVRAIWHGLMMLGDGGNGAALAQYIRFDTSPIRRTVDR